MGTSLFRRFWGVLLGLTAVMIWGLMTLWHQNDLDHNYIRAEGRANHVERHCFIVETGLFAAPDQEIDCRDEHQVHTSRHRKVKMRSLVRFEFISPRDHIRYMGEAAIRNQRYGLPRPGESITIFIHKTKPATFEYGGRWQEIAQTGD